MARGGSGFSTILLLVLLGTGAFLLYEYVKSKDNQNALKKNGSGVGFGSGGGSGAGAAIQGVGSSLLKAWTQLTKAFASGQTLADMLPTSSPNVNALIPSVSSKGTSMSDLLNSFSQPFNPDMGLFDLGGGMGALDSLGTTDPSSTALLQMEQPQSFDMSGIGFSPSSFD